MPEFSGGELKTAIIPMSNPTEKAFDYTVELYMGVELALMSQADFHLEAGETKDISLEVTMPSVAGTYPVNIAVFSGGEFIPPIYKGEDVTITTKAIISSVTWELVDYPFVGDWPEETGPLHATFCKGTLQVESADEFVGSVKISCPNTIAPIPLLTIYGYQQLLAELDELIAGSTGAAKTLWENRKALALGFPTVDNFTIDYRWWADLEQKFRDWINGGPVEVFTLDNVLILAGVCTVEVGFFAKYGAAIGLFPVTVRLYSDEALIGSIVSDLVPPSNVPQLLSITIPASVASGGDIATTTVLRLPPQTNLDYSFSLYIVGRGEWNRIASASYANPTLVNTQLARGCTPSYLPLDAPDNIYTIEDLGKAEYYTWRAPWAGGGYYTPLPPGIYPVSLNGESWRISLPATGCGINVWGYEARYYYSFGVVGYIEVT